MLTVAFSGGCFSGKTSTIEYIASNLDFCIISNEVIRSKNNFISIEHIRQSPNEYVLFQDEVIRKKIETDIFKQKQDKRSSVLLIDRALTDSYMYLTNYVDLSKLTTASLKIYNELLIYLTYNINHFEYDLVIQFYPIKAICEDDIYRPNNIDFLKYIEYNHLDFLNTRMYKSKLVKYDLNVQRLEGILDLIESKI
jgi:hypothetical protein